MNIENLLLIGSLTCRAVNFIYFISTFKNANLITFYVTPLYFKLKFLLFFLHGVFVFSQSTIDNRTYEIFDEIVGLENTNFFNGPQFKDEYPKAVGDSRYFNQNVFAPNKIEYDGQWFSNVPLEYDIFSDNVITRSNDHMSNFIVQLIPGYISKFIINGHNFVKLEDSKFSSEGNGFYEVATVGKSFELYIKHFRNIKELTVDFAFQKIFVRKNYYLVHYEGAYHVINSSKDFKKVVSNRYKEVQKFRKDYKSIYKSDRTSFMIKLVEYLNGN